MSKNSKRIHISVVLQELGLQFDKQINFEDKEELKKKLQEEKNLFKEILEDITKLYIIIIRRKTPLFMAGI